MRKILFIVLSVFNAFMHGVSPCGARTKHECRDTIRVADTVWVSATERAPLTAEIPDVILDDTFNRGIGKATALFVPKGTV